MKWQPVKRMTLPQKGEIVSCVQESGRFDLVRGENGEYIFVREDGTESGFKLRRCVDCGYVTILFDNGNTDCPFCEIEA
jgi:hypothetical protein